MFLLILILVVLMFSLKKERLIGGEKIISNEDIEKITKKVTLEFCNYLDSKADRSSCATCNVKSYESVQGFGIHSPSVGIQEYIISKSGNEEGETIFVNVKAPIIYGYETRADYSKFNFSINDDGEVINKNFPGKTCI